MEMFDIAQVCENGHLVNNSTISLPKNNSAKCGVCDGKTIVACPNCQESIPGSLLSSTSFDIENFDVPAYCHHCGELYPWTNTKVNGVVALFVDKNIIPVNEKPHLIAMMMDLVTNSHNNKLASLHVKTLMEKLEAQEVTTVKTLLSDVVGSQARKAVLL